MTNEKDSLSEKFSTPDTRSSTLVHSPYSHGLDLEAGIGAEKPVRSESWFQRLQARRQQNQCEEGPEVITRSLEECPNGYPKLAAFLSSEHNFMLYRSFSGLHSRVLLNIQDEIVALERELDELDIYHDEDEKTRRRLKSRAFELNMAKKERDEERPRQIILAELQTKLVAYDELLLKARELNTFQRPSNRDYRSVTNWIWNHKPLLSKDQEFIQCKEDIISLRHGREWAGFDGFVESQLRKMDCKLIRRLFCTPELRQKTTDPFVFYYSASRVEAFVGIIITFLIFILLVLPVVAMYELTSIGTRSSTFDAVGVLVVFTLLFCAAMSLLTKARRHELFAASAAYCAILVVFITNFSSTPSGSGH